MDSPTLGQPAGRPARRRPAARARLAAGFGSIGALVGLTAGLALDASPGSAGSAAPAPPPVPAEPTARTAGWEEDDDTTWWERVGAEVGERLFDEDDDEYEYEEREDEYGDGWSVPAPDRSAPAAPQTRSAGS